MGWLGATTGFSFLGEGGFSPLHNGLFPPKGRPSKWLILVFLLLFQFHGECLAWNTASHPYISQRAFSTLPEDMQRVLDPYLDIILRASVVPDVILMDWPNHELNILDPSSDRDAAPNRIASLCSEITKELGNEDRDLAKVAYYMGLLSHYLADINQPLHTDNSSAEESWIHPAFEMDVLKHQTEISLVSTGTSFWVSPKEMTRATARRANAYYWPIIHAYTNGNGWKDVKDIAALNFQRAVDDVHDIWLTLWLLANPKELPAIALKVNQKEFKSGDTLRIEMSTLVSAGKLQEADIYIVIVADNGRYWFVGNGGSLLVSLPIPWMYRQEISSEVGIDVFSMSLDPGVPTGGYTVYGVLVTPGAFPLQKKLWLSNPAWVSFDVTGG